MSKLTEQLPLKVSPEMKSRIEKQRLDRLKSGEDISISELTRCLLNKALLEETTLSYDEICLLGSYIRGQDIGTTWYFPLEGWEEVETSLLDKELIMRNDAGAYIPLETGIKTWNELPDGQKNNLLLPRKRISKKAIYNINRTPITNLERFSGIIDGIKDGQNIETIKGMLRGVLKSLELEMRALEKEKSEKLW
jgi:hypothetical protein